MVLDVWWPDDEPDAGDRLTTRVAALLHFAEMARTSTVRQIEDLAPHFREIELLLELDQYSTALERMTRLDREFLRGWGYRHVQLPWRRELQEWEVGSHWWRANLSAMAAAALELDHFEQSDTYLRRALDTPGPRGAAPTPIDAPTDLVIRQEELDRLPLMDQLARACLLAGRVASAMHWFVREQDEAESRDVVHERARAHLGIASCLTELGQVRDAERYVQRSGTFIERCREEYGCSLRTDWLLASSTLHRLKGDSAQALSLAGEAAHLASADEPGLGAGNDQLLIRALDLQAGVHLEDDNRDAALELAAEASAVAAGTGATDATRTAHATLALALIDQGQLEDAVGAARAATRFFRSPRSLVGEVVLGVTLVRAGNSPDLPATQRDHMLLEAGRALQDAVSSVGAFQEAEGRPYWVWEALGLAQAARHLLGAPGAETLSIEAYLRARDLISQTGARRRAAVFLNALTEDGDDRLSRIRGAAMLERVAAVPADNREGDEPGSHTPED